MKKLKKALSAKENFKKKMPSKSLKYKFRIARLLPTFQNLKKSLPQKKHQMFFKGCTKMLSKQR
jgi:hypothetical protein